MRLEAFTCHKDPLHPLGNDDRLVVYGGRLFAVIDGVTDKSGSTLPDGSSRGQAAGVLLERALRHLVDQGRAMSASTSSILDLIESTFSAEYRRLAMTEAVARDPHLRFGAQLAAVFYDGAAWRVLVVGDCGVRVDGDRVIGTRNRGDAVLALWRSRVFAATSAAPDTALDVARGYTVTGSGRFLDEYGAWFDESKYRRVRDEAGLAARSAFPDLSAELIDDTLAQGLIGLAKHRNSSGPLGSPCIDGSRVPVDQVSDQRFAVGAVTTLELFSDGYFGTPPRGATHVSDWEAHLAQVEAVDLFKVAAHPSTKGSSSGQFTDDRTVLVIAPDDRLTLVKEREVATR